jgi:hypothetical protein
MYDSAYQEKWSDENFPPETLERRNGTERRKESACGFTYISTVGWICRREQCRRKVDAHAFIDEISV